MSRTLVPHITDYFGNMWKLDFELIPPRSSAAIPISTENPMNHTTVSPFDSIESAYDFAKLLSNVVGETRKEIDADIERESTLSAPRRLDALRMASYNL